MKPKERLMNTLQGKAIDRPAVSFYEINGLENTTNQDPFNIYNDPSWLTLIELTREKTDRIVTATPSWDNALNPLADFTNYHTWEDNKSKYGKTEINIGGRTLTSSWRQDRDILTTWRTEHLLKTTDDIEAYLQLPLELEPGTPNLASIHDIENKLDDSGIAMIDTPDPLCIAADLFEMSEYTIIALTEQDIFHRLLEHISQKIYEKTRRLAKAFPGRLWRIYGPEYASEPYLPPHLFREYVTKYDTTMVEIIHATGGYVRLHSHGFLKNIMRHIIETGCDGLDPIEPTPQGDVSLEYIRQEYGQDLVLFGNLEASDLVNLPSDKFKLKVEQALKEGTAGQGRGFVLLPSACPYHRHLPSQALRNYEVMIDCVEAFS